MRLLQYLCRLVQHGGARFGRTVLLVEIARPLRQLAYVAEIVHFLADQYRLIETLGRVEQGTVLAVTVGGFHQTVAALVQRLCVPEAGG